MTTSRFTVVSRGFIVFFMWASVALASAAKQTATLVIPDYTTAKEQYGFALMYEKSQFTATEASKRKQQIQKISQCYQRVIDNFPHDTEFTARAYLQLGDCQAKISEPDAAMKYYNVVLNTAVTDEYLQARAMFSVGQMMDLKKEYAKAKTIYKEIIDRYSTSSSGAVRDITKRASAQYFQVREQPAQKKKWAMPKLFGARKSS